jgi:WD40 repeat protein
MAELYRYAAFISYSSKDARFAQRLHRTLEHYNIPTALGRFDLLGGGGKANRIYPVFRDREELPTGELGEVIEAALRASGSLVVICSPHSAASPWVQKEIKYFASIGRRDRVFTVIADNAPLTDAFGDATSACIPPSLRDGGLEPLAADARKGRDGFRGAWLKIVAGLIGVNAGALADRDRHRRRMRGIQVAAASLATVAALTFGGVFVASNQLQQRSNTLAELARVASDNADYLRAARYARAALTGSRWPLVRFDTSAAVAELRRAAAESRLRGVMTDSAELATLAVSPDGARVASGNAEGVVRIWNLADGRLLHEMTGHTRAISDLAFSPDGRRLVSGSLDQRALVWDVETGRQLFRLTGHSAGLMGNTAEVETEFSPDGRRIVTIGADSVRIWDSETGQQTAIINEILIWTAVFSPDGQHILTAGQDPHIWNAADGSEVASLDSEDFIITGVAYSPDGARIITASAGRGLRLWDARRRVSIAEMQGHRDMITSLGFSPDGSLAFTTGLDGTARLWDGRTGEPRSVLEAGGAVRNAMFSPDGATLVTASSNRTASVWDVSTGAVLHTLVGHDRIVMTAAYTDNDSVVTAGDTTLRLWDVSFGPDAETEVVGNMRTGAFSPDGSQLVTGGNDVRIWDADTLHQLSLIDLSASQVSYSPDGHHILIAGNGAAVAEATSGRVTLTIPGLEEDPDTPQSESWIDNAYYSPDGRRIMTQRNAVVRVFDASSGRELEQFDNVNSINFSPDLSRLIVTGRDGRTRILDAESRREIGSIQAIRETMRLAVFLDDARIATQEVEGLVRIWNARNLREVSRSRDAGLIFNLAFDPQGRRFAATAYQQPVRVWDSATGRRLFRLRGRDVYAAGVAFSPDGRRLLIASETGVASIWRLNDHVFEDARALADNLCETTLIDPAVSRFSQADLEEAPVLDPDLDGDVCRTPSLMERAKALISGVAPN